VVYYTDDTLVVAGGQDWDVVVANENIAVECVLRSIEKLVLGILPQDGGDVFPQRTLGRRSPAGVKVDRAHIKMERD